MSPDKFYGFQETAEFCEHVITSLFSVTTPPSSAVGVGQEGLDTPPHSPTLGKEAPPPLGEFIAYALYRTRLPIAITHQALLLLSRLKARYPSARGTSTSPHRLFLSSLMLSSKISMDDTYSNKSWQVVGQFFDLKEVNQMERELFAFLGWNVVVRDEELTAWVHGVYDTYQAERGQVAAVVAAAAPLKSMEDRKRRRDSTTASSVASTSTSRSPSPDELRHRRASDAAVALLHGASDAFSSSASRRPRGRHSPYSASTSASSSRPSSIYSASSSTLSSPISGSTTPGSPSTPVSAGPLTPDHRDHLAPPCWAKMGLSTSGKEDKDVESYHGPEPVQVASW